MSDDTFIGKEPRKILFSVLNWGLGHATRSIPIINKLLSEGHDILLASDGQAGLFLNKTFPQLKYYELTPYNIRYNNEQIEWSVFNQSFQLTRAISRENNETSKICQDERVDWIISDSRFGVRQKHILSTIISHQLNLISNKRLFAFLGNQINKHLLEKFDECWVPDDGLHSLSGLLSSMDLSIPIRYIGKQSRFEYEETETDIDVLIVLSGPEPKRTEVENKIKTAFSPSRRPMVMVRGVVDQEIKQDNFGSMIIYNFQNGKGLNHLLNRSKLVIGRSGYSSIMDYVHLNKKAILIPTPGQTEQLYLAEHLDNYTNFSFLNEDNIEKDLNNMVEMFL